MEKVSNHLQEDTIHDTVSLAKKNSFLLSAITRAMRFGVMRILFSFRSVTSAKLRARIRARSQICSQQTPNKQKCNVMDKRNSGTEELQAVVKKLQGTFSKRDHMY